MKNELLKSCEQAIGKCITESLTSYNSPLQQLVKSELESAQPELKEMVSAAISELICDDQFKETLNTEIKRKLSKVLINSVGGEIERTVNKLKSDPVTRSKITIAIDSVVNGLLNN